MRVFFLFSDPSCLEPRCRGIPSPELFIHNVPLCWSPYIPIPWLYFLHHVHHHNRSQCHFHNRCTSIIALNAAQVTHRSQISDTLQSFYRSRIIRTSAIQGLSRIASDLIVKNFDTPMKVLWTGDNRDVSLVSLFTRPYFAEGSTKRSASGAAPLKVFLCRMRPIVSRVTVFEACVFVGHCPDVGCFTSRVSRCILFVSTQVSLSPLSMDAPGGINSVMTSLMKPVLPLIFFAQFMYLYRCGRAYHFLSWLRSAVSLLCLLFSRARP